MELIQIDTVDDIHQLTTINELIDEFEVRMPNHLHQMYSTRNHLNDIACSMINFINYTESMGYTHHKWFDDHRNELVYEFNKE